MLAWISDFGQFWEDDNGGGRDKKDEQYFILDQRIRLILFMKVLQVHILRGEHHTEV